MSNLKTLVFLIVLTLMGSALSVNAQLVTGSALKVYIPNPFLIKDESFPAGEYTISRTPTTADSSSVLMIRGNNGQSMIFNTDYAETRQAADRSMLIFDNFGGMNILSQIWVKGEIVGNAVPKTGRQRQLVAQYPRVRHVTIAGTLL